MSALYSANGKGAAHCEYTCAPSVKDPTLPCTIVVTDSKDVANAGGNMNMSDWVCRMTEYTGDGFMTRQGWSILTTGFMGLPLGTKVKTIWTTGFRPIINVPGRGWYPVGENMIERVMMDEIQQLVGPRVRGQHNANAN